MPVERTPPRGARTRSRARLEEQGVPPLLGVENHPVAPIHRSAQERGEEAPPPPLIEGRGDPPPSPEPNIRRAPPEQEPFALRQPNEQDLPLQQQDFPLVDQDIAPQQNLQQNNLQQQDFPLVDQNIAPQQDLRQNNLQQQDFPLVDQDIAPQQDLQQNPQLNMDARFPPTLQSWEAFSQALFSIQPTLPEYTGLDYEDPDRYLTKCQEYVTTLQIPNANKVSVLEKGLKGAAEKWWLSSRLKVKKYGTSQTEKESVGTFLQQKYMLYQRLRPDEDEATKIATMIELLRPSIRKSLRPHTINDFATLLTKAQEVESDEAAEKNTSTNKPKPKDSEQPKEKKKQLPKCWHCEGYHYNRDCPTRKDKSPQENWRGGGTPPATSTQSPQDHN
ncbi:hypothetical protein TKK_0007990 [Trichogramma kaykai]